MPYSPSGWERLDRKLAKARAAVGRIVRFHAEKDTLADNAFEAAVRPLQEEVARMEQQRERLLSALPGGKVGADGEMIRQIAAEFADGLDQLSFTEKQQVLALLDVQVRLEPTARIAASLAIPRPAETDQRIVLNRTFSPFPEPSNSGVGWG